MGAGVRGSAQELVAAAALAVRLPAALVTSRGLLVLVLITEFLLTPPTAVLAAPADAARRPRRPLQLVHSQLGQ